MGHIQNAAFVLFNKLKNKKSQSKQRSLIVIFKVFKPNNEV